MAVEITAFFIGENMTVPVSDRLSQLYVGNGANTRFDFTFRVFQQEDETGIAVRQKGVTEFDTIDPSTYSVSVNQDGMGGFITFITAPAIGSYFYIAGLTVLDQLLDITNYDNFYPDALERALDKLTALLQERSTEIDLEKQARILADIHYDALAMEREADLENRLISYINAMIGITNPAIFDGISDRMIITQDGRTQREFNESIPFWTGDYVNFKQETYLREEQILDHVAAEDEVLDSKINNESSRAQAAEDSLQIQLNAVGVGNKAYKTYALMDADKTNIPAKSKVTVTNDETASNNGDWQWDGVAFTKSDYDLLPLAKSYVDAEIERLGLIETTSYTSSILTIAQSLSSTTGEGTASSNWLRTGTAISVNKGDVIELKAVSNAAANANILFFDSASVFVSADTCSINDTVQTKKFTVAQDGSIHVATRVGTSTEFSLSITQLKNSLKDSDVDVTVASTALTKSLISGAEHYFKSMQAITTSTLDFYIDANGNAVALGGRRYRKVTLTAGETVFYKGFFFNNVATTSPINPVVFVADASIGIGEIVEYAPTTTTADFWYEGSYTATESGSLYLNLHAVSSTNVAIDTSLIYVNKGVENVDFFTTSVPSNIVTHLKARTRNASQAPTSGGAILLDSTMYDIDVDNILFLNGSKQTTQYSTSQQQSIYIPVFKGDKLQYTGYFPSNSASNLNHIIQCDIDKNPISSLYSQPSANGTVTVTVTATQDGYISVRQVNVLQNNVTYASSVYYTPVSYASTHSNQEITLMNTVEELPKLLSMDHGYNSQTYTQNNLVEVDGYTYFVGVDEERKPFILQREPFKKDWNHFDLSAISGNPFNSPNALDSHNNFVLVVTKDGYIIVTGNHHNDYSRCARSNSPHDISAWTKIMYTEGKVTYPRLLRNGDTTLGFWREGESGDGQYYMGVFNDTTLLFNTKKLLIEKATNVATSNPYEQTVGIGSDGVIHLCWGYRTVSNSAVANSGMYYAKSADLGETWTSVTADTTFILPMTEANSERIYVVSENQGYVNQNGGCVDLNGNYHTVFWHSDPETGFSRIMHVWWSGAGWNSEVVHNLGRAYPPSSALLPGHYTRPHIVCSQAGRLFVIFKNNYDNTNRIVAVDVTDSANHVEMTLINFGTRQTELALNIEFPFNDNEVKMVLAKGGGNVTNAIWQNQSAYLVTIPLPVQYSI